MKMRIALAAFAVVIGASSGARADPARFSGNEILESCRLFAKNKVPISANDALYEGDCAGMTRTLAVIGSYLPQNMRFCTPPDVTFQQTTKVFVAFLDAHPERLQEPATVLAMDAFRVAWPCSDAPAAKQ
jgi:hypothetical protein